MNFVKRTPDQIRKLYIQYCESHGLKPILETPAMEKAAEPQGSAPLTATSRATLPPRTCPHCGMALTLLIALGFLPLLAHAQVSPFETGATALQTNLLTLMTPVAIILVIALGIAAMVNRISWGWAVAAVAGIAVSFGAPQIVDWVRGMFAV